AGKTWSVPGLAEGPDDRHSRPAAAAPGARPAHSRAGARLEREDAAARGIHGEAAGGAALAQLRRARAPLRDDRAQGRDPDRRRIARARASPGRLPHEALAPARLLHPERRNIEHADQALPHLLGRRDVATAPLLGHQLVAAPPVDAAAPG